MGGGVGGGGGLMYTTNRQITSFNGNYIKNISY